MPIVNSRDRRCSQLNATHEDAELHGRLWRFSTDKKIRVDPGSLQLGFQKRDGKSAQHPMAAPWLKPITPYRLGLKSQLTAFKWYLTIYCQAYIKLLLLT
ncbi:hypothetical protein FRB95_001746 [Tulasnella sp. JGI-2019a]|nr:hypothetical protein FRB95_001746 [Tulasnella sp. JGI-2019a]